MQGVDTARPTRYCETIQEKTVVAETSLIFQGLDAGSSMLVSNFGRGMGWKFFRPEVVIAGFRALENSGLILSFRMSTITGQKEPSARDSSVYVSNSAVASVKVCPVVQALFSEAKLANAKTVLGALAVF